MSTLSDAGHVADDSAIPSGFAELLAPSPVKPRAAESRNLVALQLRHAGGVFFTVCRFDIDCELSEHYVRSAVELLSAVQTDLHWRVIAPGFTSGAELLTYNAATGWQHQ